MARGAKSERTGLEAKRGVSPIIATILLVAITVVLAAVLYVLVSGYAGSPGHAPLAIELGGLSYGHSAGTPVTYYLNFSITSSSSSLNTGDFALKTVDINGATISLVSISLINSTGSLVSIFTPASGSWNSVTAVHGDLISIDMGTQNLEGTGDTVQAYGLGGNSVSGGYTSTL